MPSPQALSEADRRLVAAWAADCAERVLPLFQAEAPNDDRPRDAVARARAFARGDLTAAGEIKRRFVAGRAAHAVTSRQAVAAARAAAQAAGVAHMGAHALGAAAYAARAVGAAGVPGTAGAAGAAGATGEAAPDAVAAELQWQLGHLGADAAAALRRLPPLGHDSAGPLGPGLLASGDLGAHIRALQAGIEQIADR